MALLLIFLMRLVPAVVESAECLPSLGNGNICTANDFELTEILVTGPASCVEGETISQSITLRVGMVPNAKQRYDIGIFVGDDGFTG